jgi:hypothetical protein
MRRYDFGDPVPLRYTATDPDTGAPVGISGSLTLTKTDGTTYAGVTSSGGTGILDVIIPPAEVAVVGRYAYVWDITGGIADTSDGYFYVGAVDDEVPPLGSFAMLARKLGAAADDFDETERDRAEYLLDEASELIRDIAGKTWLVTGTNALDAVPRRIARICVASAARAFDNPHALSQRTTGDRTTSYDRSGLQGGEAVYLTEQEEIDVRRFGTRSSFRSVTLVSPYSADNSDLDEVVY